MIDIILASKSARRIEMMNEFGISYRIIASTKEEKVDDFKSNEDLVKKLAKNKALEVYENNKNSLVLGFDTLVFIDDKILGKPKNEEDCIKMIKMLSGKMHKVSTGAYIIGKNFKRSFVSTSKVYFMDIDDEEIIKYAKTKEPYDKAGGYAIQGFIGRYIRRIEGDIFSVIGMPKAKVYKILKEYLSRN